MAVTRDGIPVRCWTFPGSESDQRIIRTVKDDLGAWQLRRLVWVADAGFASAANRAYLTRGGGHYIHAEKLRHTNAEAAAALARPGRYHDVADNLRVKEVGWHPAAATTRGRARNGSWCATTRMPPTATPRVRQRLIEHLEGLIEGSDTWPDRRRDELVGSLKNNEPPWFRWRLSLPGEDASMASQRKYPQELRERGTRMALEARRDPATARGAIKRIADQLGVHPEALRTWVRQAEIDEGARTGTTSEDGRRIVELERENRELRRANEILRTASAFFAAAEVDRRLR